MKCKKMNKKISKLIMANALAIPFAAPLLHAQNSRLEEVIVTSQKREENLQAIPVAVTAMTSDDLVARGITSFEGVALATPSISFVPYPSSSNTLVVFMRGLGIADAAQITSDGSVGIYQDGFYISRPQAITFDLADIERVEVLRGPQGTLYGRNTIGGAVNLISKRPTGEFGLKQDLTFGTRNQFRSLTAINLPKLGGLAAKVSFLKSSIDGYVRNTGSAHDYGEQSQLAGRLALRWDNDRDFAVDYFYENGQLDSTPVYYQNTSLNGMEPSPFPGIPYFAKGSPQRSTYRAIDLDLSNSRVENHGLTLTWDVGESFTVKSLTGFRKLVAKNYQNYAEALGTVYATEDPYNDRQFSQEFQFIGNFLDSRFNYVAGLYYYDENGSHDNRLNLQAFAMANTRLVKAESKSRAAYGQLTWVPDILDDKLELTLGARYTHDKKSANRFSTTTIAGVTKVTEYSGDPDNRNNLTFNRFNPSFTVNYHVNPDISVYAKVATGYKAGGSYESAPIGQFNHTYGPEKLTSYEIGMKSDWFDHMARLNIAIFDSRLKDKQIGISVDPQNPRESQAFNAGEMKFRGAEVELLVVPIEDLSLSLDYTYLHSEFTKAEALPGTILDNQTNPLSPYGTGDNVRRLFNPSYAPKNAFTLAGDYTFFHFSGGDLSAHLDYKWRDKIFAEEGTGPAVPGRNFASIPGYGIMGARLTSSFDLPDNRTAKISVWGKNILNRQYKQSAIPLGNPIVPTIGSGGESGFNAQAVAWSEPPTYGVDLQYEY